MKNAWTDRKHILATVDQLPPETRKELADVQETVDLLYNRAMDVARSLRLMEADVVDEHAVARLDEKIAALQGSAGNDQRTRQLELLERQKRTLGDLFTRRNTLLNNLESCVLAMQNLRLDVVKLKTSDVASVLGDLSQATQQARALSRSVDNAIAAAGEVREALR